MEQAALESDKDARIAELEAECETLRKELAEAIADGEMMRGEARMLSDKCMQFADQAEALRKRIGELEAKIKSQTHLAEISQKNCLRWMRLHEEEKARAEQAEAQFAVAREEQKTTAPER